MERKVLASWHENANEWIKALEEKKISSRRTTNKAIVKILSELPITKILDLGCGEGWLTRNMTKLDKKSVGIDGTLKLLESARKKGSETYYWMGYEEISSGAEIPESPFDAVVLNFCIYQKKGLVQFLKKVKKALTQNGSMVIQTIHPDYMKQNKLPYKSQWILDSWKGLSGDFKNGHPWYARTFDDWESVFRSSKLRVQKRIEVKDFESKSLSVIFVLR